MSYIEEWAFGSSVKTQVPPNMLDCSKILMTQSVPKFFICIRRIPAQIPATGGISCIQKFKRTTKAYQLPLLRCKFSSYEYVYLFFTTHPAPWWILRLKLPDHTNYYYSPNRTYKNEKLYKSCKWYESCIWTIVGKNVIATAKNLTSENYTDKPIYNTNRWYW